MANGVRLPIRELTPPDFGGIAARQGFAYQDHVAVHFLLRMLEDDALSEVWCETYDDIVLIWSNGGIETVEFIQVKGELLDQLWTLARLCSRTKSNTNTNGVGTSIIERSMARGCCKEESVFRLITRRGFESELMVLTLDRSHSERTGATSKLTELCTKLKGKLSDGLTAENKAGLDAWVVSAVLESHELEAIEDRNKVSVYGLLSRKSIPGTPDMVDSVYNGLLSMAKTAAERPWVDKHKKMLKKSEVDVAIAKMVNPYPSLGHEAALERKMTDSGLDKTYIETAKELRRAYHREVMEPKFLDAGEREYFDSAVLEGLLKLRTDLDSGIIQEDGSHFHRRCITTVDGLKDSHPATIASPPPGYLTGCMYEITARCRHRFAKLAQ